MQQHSKRSSSNFSNGSSSCGRTAGGHTGGRYKMNVTTIANQAANGNAFSPLLNNMVITPNQQYVSQRIEGDIDQLYDEILDEEEEMERKQTRIQKKKHRKDNGLEDDSEDESMYEDEEEEEDFLNPNMSGEEDLDDL